MRIVFLGSGSFGLPTLRRLVEQKHDVGLVITQPPKSAGRGRKLSPTPVSELAAEFGLRTLAPENINSGEIIREISATHAHLGVVVAYGQKLGSEVRAVLPGGFINLHASLLPKYRGAAPIHWAILNGEERTGCSVFRIVERMDAGPILSSRWTFIKPDETSGELHDRLAGVGVDAVDAALSLFANGFVPSGTPQNEADATRSPKLGKEDGFVHFDRPAIIVARHILGMTPWPGAVARFESQGDGKPQIVSLVRARRAEDPACPKLPPGTIDSRLFVAAADGFVEILEIKPAGGRVMNWQDFVNGRHVRAGDRFDSLTRIDDGPGEK